MTLRVWLVCPQGGLVGQMEWNVRRVLGGDTAAISTLRCLKLYLERLGCNFLHPDTLAALAGSSFALVQPHPSLHSVLCWPCVTCTPPHQASRVARALGAEESFSPGCCAPS